MVNLNSTVNSTCPKLSGSIDTVIRKFFFFFFHWHYSPLWALACRRMSFHFFLSATNSLHLVTSSTWRSLSLSSFHLFLGLPLLLVPSSPWVKIFLGILSSSILSRRPNRLILCPFIHFTIFSPLLISSSSRFVRLFYPPFSYLAPYILLNIFLSEISRACSSFFARVIRKCNSLFSPLKTKEIEGTILPNTPRFSKEHYFWECS